jgi:ABC-2 type transport system ATP-binding protein
MPPSPVTPHVLFFWAFRGSFGDVGAVMIEVSGLTKLYGEVVAVNDLSFNVQSGEVMGLVGPNGAGKTTTLRSLAGIIPPTRGVIRICGHDLAREPLAAKKQLAFFTDEPRLFDYLTVEQHLAFTARVYQVADYETLADPLLEELELAGKRNALPGELSRGMKQKLAIACGLLHSPKVMYFDEPLTGLDPIGIRRMKGSILKRAREGAAIIISSHLLHLVEEICSHILILKNGRKIIDGTLEDITRRFSEQPGDANLEEVFFRATSESGSEAPAAPPPIVGGSAGGPG